MVHREHVKDIIQSVSTTYVGAKLNEEFEGQQLLFDILNMSYVPADKGKDRLFVFRQNGDKFK